MPYLFLGLAILSEVIGTSALKMSEEFTKIGPSIVVVLGYGAAFYFLSIALSSIQVGVAYGIWAGLGIVLITLIGAVFFKEIPDLPAILGLLMIITGVMVIHFFSKTASH
ncbi:MULTISPECIES: SMR family transporter [unclassified Pseudoalteromonas]|uniref:DMT family transporter n=1 Tax=unclassified Pseudoalteromonas TaxID=194690 RepID=UPI0025B4F244|nr:MULTISPECIES: SMR family transporter [unclassified Pseudoalteromonas]MDN3378975.1 SMR family transporter [Pseudoalteromonas sp. APC 3893]MDN3387621.1 SMR family transporter [Pseudoalteromonas sp. APC 4017]